MKKVIQFLGYLGLAWYSYDDALAALVQMPMLGILPWPVVLIPAFLAVLVGES